MDALLATAGLADAAFIGGLMLFLSSAIGTVLGIAGIIYRLRRPAASPGWPTVLALLALVAIGLYVLQFWHANGDDALDHAARHFFTHVVLIGSPLLSAVTALFLAWCGRSTT
jgi:hypothetical protein